MAIQIKPVDVIAAKYASRGAAAGQDYSNGVNNPRQDWQTATAASSSTYAAGVQQAISNNSFSKGVAAAGTDKWKRKAATVGAQRYGPGVTAAKQDYANGVGKFLQVIANLTLPPRGPKGDPGNIARVSMVAQALRAAKLAG